MPPTGAMSSKPGWQWTCRTTSRSRGGRGGRGWLQSDPAYVDLPVLVLTTVVEDASRRRYELETGQSMRVLAYLQKPVAPEPLLRAVAGALEKGPSCVPSSLR